MIVNSIKIAAVAALVGLSGGAAVAQSAGDWVLGRWQGGAYWYPAVIQSVSGDKLTLRYDDGDKEVISLSKVRPYDWAIGKTVECNYQGKGEWYQGKIASLGGESIGVNYDDGDKEKTRTGRCRSK